MKKALPDNLFCLAGQMNAYGLNRPDVHQVHSFTKAQMEDESNLLSFRFNWMVLFEKPTHDMMNHTIKPMLVAGLSPNVKPVALIVHDTRDLLTGLKQGTSLEDENNRLRAEVAHYREILGE